jgi:hypothetical protein
MNKFERNFYIRNDTLSTEVYIKDIDTIAISYIDITKYICNLYNWNNNDFIIIIPLDEHNIMYYYQNDRFIVNLNVNLNNKSDSDKLNDNKLSNKKIIYINRYDISVYREKYPIEKIKKIFYIKNETTNQEIFVKDIEQIGLSYSIIIKFICYIQKWNMRDLISIIPFEQNTYNIIKYYYQHCDFAVINYNGNIPSIKNDDKMLCINKWNILYNKHEEYNEDEYDEDEYNEDDYNDDEYNEDEYNEEYDEEYNDDKYDEYYDNEECSNKGYEGDCDEDEYYI